MHCDVSPDNILVSFDGSVKVVDFGLARLLDSLDVGEAPRAGKLPYMAPEQLRSERLDARADLFAMGVVLYELVTGVRPFDGVNPAHDRAPLAPRKRQSSLPRRLETVILRALEPKADDRFATAAQMADALEHFLERSGKRVSSMHLAALMRELFGAASESLETLESEDVRPRTEALLSDERGVPPPLESQLLPRDPGVQVPLRVPTSKHWRRRVRVTGAVIGLVGASAWGVKTLIAHRTVPQAVGLSVAPPPPAPQNRMPAPPGPPAPKPSQPFASSESPRTRTANIRKAPSRKTGKVALLVNPWADVFFQGKQLGQTPLPPLELPAGEVTLTLVNDELSIREEVHLEILAGQTVIHKVDLFDAFAARHGATKTP